VADRERRHRDVLPETPNGGAEQVIVGEFVGQRTEAPDRVQGSRRSAIVEPMQGLASPSPSPTATLGRKWVSIAMAERRDQSVPRGRP
jgi:hypothetical protein